MSENCTSDREHPLQHEVYGNYDDKPHVAIQLNWSRYHEAVQPVLNYDLGPAVAWEYDGGMLFMWGDELDDALLRDLCDGVNEYEQELARDGHYEAAESAREAASWITRADIENTDSFREADQ